MVDHRADDDQGLSFLVNAREQDDWAQPGLLQQARAWLSERFAKRTDRPYVSRNDAPEMSWGDWLHSNRLAVGLSAIWAGALIAYGIGYFARLGSTEGSVSMMPTLDLVFFIFAILGPIAMVWFAVAMLSRAAHLSEAITGQSESALALAATINNLNDSVDALSMGTTGRLEQACDRMEREATASVQTLEKSLATSTEKLETALLDGVILMDRNMRERSEKVAAKLEAQQLNVANELQASIQTIQATFERESSNIGAQQRDQVARIEQNLAEITKRLGKTLEDLATQQKAGLGAANDVIANAANGLASELTETLKKQITQVDHQLKSANTDLAAVASATSQTVRDDLGGALKSLGTEVDEMRKAISANPPATAEDLAALMGEAVHRIVSPERAALTQSVLRITALEEQARALLAQIDRTSRLVPLLDSSIAQPDTEKSDDTALFGSLPVSNSRRSLNWTAVIHILSGRDAVPGTREVIQQTLRDPDIDTVIQLRDAILNDLGEHGLFSEDIKPQHSSPAVWHACISGQNSEQTKELAGVRDEVSNAIARGWLRQNNANLAVSLKYLQTYQRLLRRALGDACEDRHLVELADTSAGRLFILLGGLNALFSHAIPALPEKPAH